MIAIEKKSVTAEARADTRTGVVEFAQVDGRSFVTRDRATSPLKLLCPNRAGAAPWVYTSSYGGGFVAGDHVDLDITVHPGAVGVVTTQASTKVYRRSDAGGASQSISADIASGGTLIVAPDPVVCFADAEFDQRQRYGLAGDANLVLLDWYTAGRVARGERWAMARLRSIIEIKIDGRLVAHDGLLLDRTHGRIDSAARMGRYNCLATLILVGPLFVDHAESIAKRFADMPITERADLIVSAARRPWGVLMRIAAVETRAVADMLKRELRILDPLLGEGLWDRKW